MENDSLSTKIKVLIVSIILVAVVIIVYSMDIEQSWGIEKIISCVLLSFYSFFFSPMIKYIFNWFKTASLEESVYVGYKIGYYGIIGLILIDPIVGVMYYLNKYFHKNNSNRNGNNIIMVGFYIEQ